MAKTIRIKRSPKQKGPLTKSLLGEFVKAKRTQLGLSVVPGALSYDQGNDRLKMSYSGTWKAAGFPLSPHFPLEGALSGGATKKFIENLFPEGSNFEELLNEYHMGRKHTFRILQIMGKEMTGSLKFVDSSRAPGSTSFRPLSEEELEQRLDEGQAVLKALKNDQIKTPLIDEAESDFLLQLKENIAVRTEHLLWCSEEMLKLP